MANNKIREKYLIKWTVWILRFNLFREVHLKHLTLRTLLNISTSIKVSTEEKQTGQNKI